MLSMIFAFMDECLFKFCSDDFVAKDMKIINFDPASWTVQAAWYECCCSGYLGID